MDYVMRRRSTVGGALEMFSLPLPLPLRVSLPYLPPSMPVPSARLRCVNITVRQRLVIAAEVNGVGVIVWYDTIR